MKKLIKKIDSFLILCNPFIVFVTACCIFLASCTKESVGVLRGSPNQADGIKLPPNIEKFQRQENAAQHDSGSLPTIISKISPAN
jgi:hypothetical protein